MDAAQLAALIAALRGADNTARRSAESAQSEYLKRDAPGFIDGLCQLIEADTFSPEDRQYAAYLLRYTFTSLSASGERENGFQTFAAFSPTRRHAVRVRLVELLQLPLPPETRLRLVEAIASFAELLFLAGDNWPELPSLITEMTQSSDDDTQKLGALLVGELCNSSPTVLRLIATEIIQLIQTVGVGCSNDAAVHLSSGISSLIISSSKKDSYFPALISAVPLLWNFLRNALETGDEAASRSILQEIISMANFRPKLVKKQLVEGFITTAEISISESIPDIIRRSAFSLFLVIAKNFPEAFPDCFTPESALEIFLQIVRWVADIPDAGDWEQGNEDTDSHADADSVHHARIGENGADSFAMSLGLSVVYPLLVEAIPKLLASSEWRIRHTGVIILSLVAEGCARDAKDVHITQITKWIISLYQDPTPRVRWAVCHALGQCCTDFAPRIQELCHVEIANTLHSLLKDSVGRVAAHAAAAMINFFNISSKVCAQYAETTIQLLIPLMESGRMLCQKRAVTCLAAVAIMVTTYFSKYYSSFVPPMLNLLEGFLSGGITEEPSKHPFESKLIEAIVLIGRAVGPETFARDGLHLTHMLTKYRVFEAPKSLIRSTLITAIGRLAGTLAGMLTPADVTPMVNMLIAVVSQPLKFIQIVRTDENDAPRIENADVLDMIGGVRISFNISLHEEIIESFQILEVLLEKVPNAVASSFNRIAECAVRSLGAANAEVKTAGGSCLVSLFKAVRACTVSQATKDEFFGNMHANVVPELSRMIKDAASNPTDLEATLRAIATFFWVSAPRFMDDYKTLVADPMCKALADAKKSFIAIMRDDEDEYSKDYIKDEHDGYLSLLRCIATDVIGEGFKTFPDSYVSFFEANFVELVDEWLREDMLCVAGIMVINDMISFSNEEGALKYVQPVLKQMAHIVATERNDYALLQACFYGFRCLFKRNPELGAEIARSYPALVKDYVEGVVDSTEFQRHAGAFENAMSSLGFVLSAYGQQFAAQGVAQNIWSFFFAHACHISEDTEEMEEILGLVCAKLQQNDMIMMGANGQNLSVITRLLISLLTHPIQRYYIRPDTVDNTIRVLKQIYFQDEAFFTKVVESFCNPIVAADLESLMSR